MIEKLTPEFTHTDERGKLVQLASCGYSQVNVLYSKAGSQRGSHYHMANNEAFYVASGSVEVDTSNGKVRRRDSFSTGSFFRIVPHVKHSLCFPEDCVLVALYDKGIELDSGGKDICS